MNQLLLMGNLTRDPETTRLPNDTVRTEFTLALSRPPEPDGSHGTDFAPCVCWGRAAEYASGLCQGDRVVVVGNLHSRSWVYEGQRRHALEVAAHHIHACTTRRPIGEFAEGAE